ncbi:MAG: hypothetical protein IM550_06540 [Microcystis sp. M54BS1]|uniref:hypothetical protein n=1 Tax=unclassified Microcystis TaxID=2643300 RepID=UPI002580D0F4|nr:MULTISPECIES: hypothetical protein [unclassified Microcystis]MCA2504773.1 hypothetical protein [Microcystis sp. M62BS1]MCA2538898.1 hypothetical protein [Microcystis sp. M54BS1]MCA2548331.1 hypothetical protein [Microcystis sp. M53BS1]MCA2569422.1 hypothetical protein [Microcystis sp. M44BS1]MCA2596542.1 hypothetical protein [Microcystis sp. M38BS1]MCA2611981.1 hypothetical protein [Microcystis sp. M27BS1]
MTTKQEYYRIFRSTKKPNDRDTLAVLSYFGNDNRYWYINSLDGRSFLGQSGHFMRELCLEHDGNLEKILSKTRETLEPLMPPNLCDFDRVNWDYVGLNYLWGECFDEIEDW